MDARQPGRKRGRPAARGRISSRRACGRVVVQLLDGGAIGGGKLLEGHLDGPVRAKDELDRVHVRGSQLGEAEPGDRHRVPGGFEVDSAPPRRVQVHDERRDGRLRVVPAPPVLRRALPEVDHRAVEDVDRAVAGGEKREIEFQLLDTGASVHDVHLRPQVRIEGVRRAPDVVASGVVESETDRRTLRQQRGTRIIARRSLAHEKGDEPHGAQNQDEGDPEQLHLQGHGVGAVVQVRDDESEVEQEKTEPGEVGRQGEGKDAVGHGERRGDRQHGKEENRAEGPRRLGVAAVRPDDPVEKGPGTAAGEPRRLSEQQGDRPEELYHEAAVERTASRYPRAACR